jgi:hypothetical protein
MGGGFSLERFKEGMSRNLQRVANTIGPVGPRVLQQLSQTSQAGLTRLRTIPWQMLVHRHLPFLVGLGVLLVLWAIWKVPQWYAASWTKLDLKDLAKLESDTRTMMVQAVGGVVLLVGLFFTWRNLRVTEQNSRQTLDLSLRGQINDRFTKAIEQLGAVNQDGKKKLEVRLGGIYALEQIAKESPDHHWPIMEVLTAYVREHAPQKEEEQRSQEEVSPPKLATDIQAILTVLGRRTRIFGKGEDQFLGLAGTALQGYCQINYFRGDTEIRRVSRHQLFSYAAASVAVISRQMCHLRAIS